MRWIMQFDHVPVMLDEVLTAMRPSAGDVIVDCTLGGAGHSAHLAPMIAPHGLLIGIDRDPSALRAASERLAGAACRVELVRGNFADLADIMAEIGRREGKAVKPNGFLFDLGVSSPQLDLADRGFTYRDDAPLDMRMDPDSQLTASHIVNTAGVAELTAIIREYGEERWASRIARFIVDRRGGEPIATTGQLVSVILAAVPAAARRDGPHPARRTFQALRIAVNDELGAVRRGVETAIALAAHGGRVVTLSYHSLEDRIIKEIFGTGMAPCTCDPAAPACVCGKRPSLERASLKPVVPSYEEIQKNPRSRSAKLRAATKVLGDQGDE